MKGDDASDTANIPLLKEDRGKNWTSSRHEFIDCPRQRNCRGKIRYLQRKPFCGKQQKVETSEYLEK